MNILGIGPLELVFIIIIMILVLGPQQMVTTARKAGAFMRKVIKSPLWGTIMDTSREIRDIPTRLVREAGLEEDLKEIRSSTQSINDIKNISISIDPLSISNQKSTPIKPTNPLPDSSDENKSESQLPQNSHLETDEANKQSDQLRIPPADENTAFKNNELKNPDSEE